MNHKRFFTGLLMLVGVASGTIACGGVDNEGFSEQWGDDDDLSAQSALDDLDSAALVRPQYPNCGILACPAGTTCQFANTGTEQCSAPPGSTCSTVNCGAYHYCQMTTTGAICVSGASDM